MLQKESTVGPGKPGSFQVEQFFQALGDKTRLRLLNLMGDKEICVCYLVEVLAVPQPKISRHLAYLRNAGIVEARREGKWMHYRIVLPEDKAAAEVLKKTLSWISSDKIMQADRARMVRACCSPALAGAPSPQILQSVAAGRARRRARATKSGR